MQNDFYDETLLKNWSERASTQTPAPLSVRSRWYRKIIVEILLRLSEQNGRILSVGSGTGRTELCASTSGLDVIASDVSPSALELCKQAGLTTIFFDVTDPSALQHEITIIYIDGVLGHFYEGDPWLSIAENLAQTNARYLLLSNDLSDTDVDAVYSVNGRPDAYFFRPPMGYFKAAFVQTDLWCPIWTHILKYRRPGRGIRRRELIVLERSIGEQTDGRERHS